MKQFDYSFGAWMKGRERLRKKAEAKAAAKLRLAIHADELPWDVAAREQDKAFIRVMATEHPESYTGTDPEIVKLAYFATIRREVAAL